MQIFRVTNTHRFYQRLEKRSSLRAQAVKLSGFRPARHALKRRRIDRTRADPDRFFQRAGSARCEMRLKHRDGAKPFVVAKLLAGRQFEHRYKVRRRWGSARGRR